MPGRERARGRQAPSPLGLTREALERWLGAASEVSAGEIHALRQRLGFTQRELARLLGVSESSVSLWEAGRRRPRGPAHRLLRLIGELAKQG